MALIAAAGTPSTVTDLGEITGAGPTEVTAQNGLQIGDAPTSAPQAPATRCATSPGTVPPGPPPDSCSTTARHVPGEIDGCQTGAWLVSRR